jgi:hypothetical protein
VTGVNGTGGANGGSSGSRAGGCVLEKLKEAAVHCVDKFIKVFIVLGDKGPQAVDGILLAKIGWSSQHIRYFLFLHANGVKYNGQACPQVSNGLLVSL